MKRERKGNFGVTMGVMPEGVEACSVQTCFYILSRLTETCTQATAETTSNFTGTMAWVCSETSLILNEADVIRNLKHIVQVFEECHRTHG